MLKSTGKGRPKERMKHRIRTGRAKMRKKYNKRFLNNGTDSMNLNPQYERMKIDLKEIFPNFFTT